MLKIFNEKNVKKKKLYSIKKQKHNKKTKNGFL